MNTPIYTVNWFDQNIPTWNNALSFLKDREGISALEIGSFEGKSARWLLENILTHSSASITCVDTFLGSEEHTEELKNNLFQRFQHNMTPFESKVIIHKGFSGDVLRTLSGKYDIVYIDGDHHAPSVLEDAVLAFPLVKYGGIMIFDDYLWTGGGQHEVNNPKVAIDAFLRCYRNKFNILLMGHQVIVQKIVQ